MLMKLTTGKENFSDSMTSVYAFFVPSGQFSGVQTHISQMARNANPGINLRQVGSPVVVSAGRGLREDVVGRWFTTDFDMPEGMIICIKAVARRRGVVYSGTRYIQMRQTAPLARMTVNLSGYEKATYTAVHQEGRFDILTEQHLAEEGVTFTNPMDHQLMVNPQAAFLFQTLQLAQGATPRPEVVTQTIQNSDETPAVSVTKKRSRRVIDV